MSSQKLLEIVQAHKLIADMDCNSLPTSPFYNQSSVAAAPTRSASAGMLGQLTASLPHPICLLLDCSRVRLWGDCGLSAQPRHAQAQLNLCMRKLRLRGMAIPIS